MNVAILATRALQSTFFKSWKVRFLLCDLHVTLDSYWLKEHRQVWTGLHFSVPAVIKYTLFCNSKKQPEVSSLV
jgi:hypothetical protein